MRIVDWKSLDAAGRGQVLARPIAATDDKVRTRVRRILDDVCVRGDAALVEYTRRFDKVALDGTLVAKETAKLAWAALPEDERAALRQAKANIEAYHKPQSPQPYTVKPMDGVVCRRVVRAIESVGLYVPGGSAPLVSSVLMLAIPAKLAGVKRVVMVSPPAADGGLDPRILAAAYLCEVDEIYAVGGAQAIGALAYGTTSIDKVMKIFGPGNIYVAEAKAQVASAQGGPAIDLPAGPSEVMVLADAQANAGFVAADLLAQAEHDPLAQCLCVCSSEDLARRIMAQIEAQLLDLSRQDIARASLAHGRIVVSEK
ncbi:MAG TPA: histidinol dehydrogenase, partial [Hellea balneolensis]|nr:histidinol dehydrogenase [Hellea balneolensis]